MPNQINFTMKGLKLVHKIIVLALLFAVISCQDKEQQLVQNFVVDQFDSDINPDELAEKYILIQEDVDHDKSLAERKSVLIEHIKDVRKNKQNLGWLYPNPKIASIKTPKIGRYKDYEGLNQIVINMDESLLEDAYVLLDNEENKILQYFMLSENKEKLVSFSLFAKGDEAWFFTY